MDTLIASPLAVVGPVARAVARAAAEVVLRAEARHPLPAVKDDEEEDFELIECVFHVMMGAHSS
jgi:hypothetical protein